MQIYIFLYLLQHFYSNNMEICSDNQEFQDLTLDEDEDYNKNENQQYIQIKQSVIRPQPKTINNNSIFTVSITQNKLDLNVVQNQYYQIKLLNKGAPIKQNIIRRFSDFDFLFQILFKNNVGYIFPAFPQKGILSYVKTKVSVTKDQIYSKNRIKMIQRFFKYILNQEKFNYAKCTEIRKFFSNQEFDMFKKIQRQKSTGIVNTGWNKLKNYFNFSRQNKYHSIGEQTKNQKKKFQNLYVKVKQLHNLVDGEISANQKVSQLNYQFPNFSKFKTLVSSYLKDLRQLIISIESLDFDVFCQNQDFMMVFKTIEALQQQKKLQQNYKGLQTKQNQFNRQRDELRQRKDMEYRKYEKKYFQILKQMSRIQQYEP